MRSLVYIVGRSFLPATSGLALRTDLTFDYFSRSRHFERRLLLAPSGLPAIDSDRAPHWQRKAIETGPAGRGNRQKPNRTETLRQSFDMLTCRWNARARVRMLGYFSGLDFASSDELKSQLSSQPDAIVFLTRSDLLPLLRYKLPRQTWILDANDSVANLTRVYDQRKRLRQIARMSNEKLCRLLEQSELQLSGQCDCIIAISPADAEYFRRSRCSCIYTEEQCVTHANCQPTPGILKYDIGFIGSDHGGSEKAATALIAVAGNRSVSHLKFAIAGRVANRLKGTALPPNLALVGEVTDSRAFLAECRATVFLSSGETGTSVKFQEAILSGSTVIANSNAARWSQAQPGRDFVLIKDSDELLRLLREKPPQISLSKRLSDFSSKENFDSRMDAMVLPFI